MFSQSIAANELILAHQYYSKQQLNFDQSNLFNQRNSSPEYDFLVLNNQLNASSHHFLDNNTEINLNKIISLDFTYNNTNFYQTITNLTWWTHVPYPKSGYSQIFIVLLAFFITIIMILIVVGNLLVCIAICTEKSLKTIQNWFIASLAVSDLLLGLVIMPFSLAYELMGYWIFGSFWCEMHHALDVLLTTASINNLCLISLDRYWSVTQAIKYLKKRTPCRAIFMIAFAWAFSAVVCLPPLVGWKKENQKLDECELSDDFGYVVYSSMGSFYIPAVVMVFVYAKIFLAARSRARKHVHKKQAVINHSIDKNIQNKQSTLIKPPRVQVINNFKDVDKIKSPQVDRRLDVGTLFPSPNANNYQTSKMFNKNNKFRAAFERFECKSQTELETNIESGDLSNEQTLVKQNHIQVKTELDEEINCDKSNLPSNKLNKDIQIKGEECIESDSKISTPTSKVTFSPKEIVFNFSKNNGFTTLLPQIVIHGSMEQLNVSSKIKRCSRFTSSVICSKLDENDLNNNLPLKQFKDKHVKLTNTLSAGQLNCAFFKPSNDKFINKTDSTTHKRSGLKRTTNNETSCNEANSSDDLNLVTSISLTLSQQNDNETSSANSSSIMNNSAKLESHERHSSLLPDRGNCCESIADLKQSHDSIHENNKNEPNEHRTKLNDQENRNYLAINSFQYVSPLSNSMLSINCDNNLNRKQFRKKFNDCDSYDYDLDEENESSFANELCRKQTRSRKKKYAGLYKFFFCRKWKIINENCLNNEEYDGYEEEDEDDDEEDDMEYDEQSGGTDDHFRQLHKNLSSSRTKNEWKKKKHEKRKPAFSITSNNNTSSSGNYSESYCEVSFTSSEKKKRRNNNLFSRFASNSNKCSTSSSSRNRKTNSESSSNDKPKDKIMITPVPAVNSNLIFKSSKNYHKQQKVDNFHGSQQNSETEYRFQANEADRQKRKIAKAREKRATLILGLIMGSFIAGWIPFFGLYLLQGICAKCKVQSALSFGYWLGYCNSAINPIIYTVFNRDFRKAFRKILFR